MDAILFSKHVKKFLEEHLDPSRPFLLGLSGGPDSMALFHWLKNEELSFSVAHVDHGWRGESREEASLLERQVTASGIPFHLKVLDPTQMQGNLENCCREERYAFFKDLTKTFGYQAVMLGHHQNDKVETVLKRLFEGAQLTGLSTMKPVTVRGELYVWRPLLQISKNEIYKYLDAKGISYFVDQTNRDTKFLRARMREQLIPQLEALFGKNVASPICQIAADAEELELYLEEKLKSQLLAIEEREWLDLRENLPMPALELKYLLRRFCKAHGVAISRQALANAAEHLLQNSAKKRISCGAWFLEIHRGQVSISKSLFACA